MATAPAPSAFAQDDEEDEEGDDDDEEGGDADAKVDAKGDDEEADEEDEGEQEAKPAAVDEVVEGTFLAQERFFFTGVETEATREKTKTTGSLTSSSVFFRELGVELPAPMGGGVGNQQAQLSAAQRVFTDLRAQLSADHIGGGDFYFRGDVRGRFTPGACDATDPLRDPSDNPGGTAPEDRNPCTRFQSGTFGGNELELRELHLSKRGDKTEYYIGRQWVLDIAAHRVDGLQIRYKKSPKITYLLFGGLHPQKISRDIRTDYPKKFNSDFDPADPASPARTDGRVMPATGGAGLAYRFEKLYGALGGAVVVPLAEEADDFGGNDQLEQPRVFLSANGYFRNSAKLDIYHYFVVDVVGSAGLGLTNGTLGLNFRPSPSLRTYIQVNRIDTESLTAVTQNTLENPHENLDPNDADANGAPTPNTGIQNNIALLRIAADEARVGLSGAFSMRRFEASTSLAVRRRPDVTLTSVDGTNTLVLPAAQDIDVTLRFVDRRSFKGTRLVLQLSKSFGFGEEQFQRASTLALRGSVSKTVKDGNAELEGWAQGVQSNVVTSADGTNCQAASAVDQNGFDACFGNGGATTVSVGGLGFYRLKSNIMAVASASIGLQKLDATEVAGTMFSQGSIIPFTAFLRLAYRF